MFHWMRKLLFIALAFAACLLFPDGREEASAVDAVSVSVEFTAGNADSDQWHCERIYNSDLFEKPNPGRWYSCSSVSGLLRRAPCAGRRIPATAVQVSPIFHLRITPIISLSVRMRWTTMSTGCAGSLFSVSYFFHRLNA